MDHETELSFCLNLLNQEGFGPVSCHKLLKSCDYNPGRLQSIDDEALALIGLNPKQRDDLFRHNKAQSQPILDWLQKDSCHHLLSLSDSRYPALLKQLVDAPLLIYGRGQIDLLNQPQIAMVGSRYCTNAGATIAKDFASYLSRHAITITSGLAQGIDGHAHQGGLEGKGSTIAVLGTGIDRIYPAKHTVNWRMKLPQKGY